MSAPVTTPTLSMQSFFSTTLSSGIVAGDTVIPLNAVPNGTEGFLVIDQDNAAREVIYFTSKDSSSVTCPSTSTGRGQGGTTATSHQSGATVKLNFVDQYFSELQNGNAFAWGSNAKLTGGPAWTSWTPTISGITAGNGVTTAKYQQIGKTLRFKLVFVFGSTSSISGNPNFTLPTASTAMIGTTPALGTGTFFDTSATKQYPVTVRQVDTTHLEVVCHFAANTYVEISGVNATVPFTFATGDEVVIVGAYEAA